jgi:WD40 repeat protein
LNEKKPVAFSPDGTLLAYRSPGASVTLSNVHNNAPWFDVSGYWFVSDAAFSPAGNILAVAADEKVSLSILTTRARWRTLYGHSSFVNAVTFSPNGDILASGSDDETVRLWKVDGAACGILRGHSCAISSVSFSPDGSLVVSASKGTSIRIWNPGTCEQLYQVYGHPYQMWLKFSANGRTLTTNMGAYRIPLLTSSASAGDALPGTSYALALVGRWLTCDLENLIWILHQFMTDVVATGDQAVALGFRSGEVIIMAFDFSRGRPWEDMTARAAPNPRAWEHSPEQPQGDVAPTRMTGHHQPWAALKRLLKRPARNDGER